jgi:hypothetical protein
MFFLDLKLLNCKDLSFLRETKSEIHNSDEKQQTPQTTWTELAKFQ